MRFASTQPTLAYNVKFSGHGHEVHGPFDNHASKSSSDKKGQALIGFTTYQLSWKGHEHHPADAYDGPQGSNFPAPTGARDEYSYGISGSAARVQVNFNDNRDTGQRFKDRVENAKNSVTEGTKDAWNKATTHNPELNRAGNAAEVVSAAAAGAGNFIGAGWELLGAGDVAQGASTLKDIAGMEALRALPPEEQLKAVRAITGAADGYDAANAAYARWAQQNPNAAAVMGAAGNVVEQVVGRGKKGNSKSNIQTAEEAADTALRAGKTSGAAAEFHINGKIYTDVSGSNTPRHPLIEEAIDNLPDKVKKQAPWYGYCGEIGCFNQSLYDQESEGKKPSLEGGSVRAVNIGSSGKGHGTPKKPCAACSHIADQFGVDFHEK